MSSFAKISIRFNADLKQFSSQIQNAQRKMQQVGKKMQSVGKGLTIGLTAPIVALGYKSVVAFDKQAKAIAQVEAGVKSTGKAAGFATEELLKMASDLQNKTIFGDEEILQGATAQLLTFTNIAGEQFARTQLAALNLATRLDGDLKSASIQLGKALNDPVANLSALSRSGIQFSKEQKAVINSLVSTNRLADAQTIILDELEKQYGGAAEAAAKAGTGPFKQLSNVLGDNLEDFGAIISEALLPFITKIKELADRFKNLDPAMKKTIAVVAALAAALGPVLAIMGFMIANIIPAMAAGFTALTGPIGLVIAAIAGIAYVVYQNWDRIKKEFNELRNYFTDLYNESLVFRIGVEQVILVFRTLYDVVKLVLNATLSGFKNSFEFILGSLKNVGKAFKAVLTGDITAIPKIFAEQVKLGFVSLSKSMVDLSGDIDDFTTSMKRNIGDAVDAVTLRKKVAFTEANVDATAIQNAVARAVIAGQSGTGGTLGRAQVESVDAGGFETGSLALESPLDNLSVDLPEQMDLIQNKFTEFKDNIINVGAEVNNALQGLAANTAQFFGEFIGSLFSGQADARTALVGLMEIVSGFLKSLGQSLIAAGVASEAFKNLFASGVGAIAAGAALIALSGIVTQLLKGGVQGSDGPRRAFADGGIVYGPTKAIFGEYSGARTNPEVVAPLDKLKGLIAETSGAGKLQGSIKLVADGKDLKAVMDETNVYFGRRR